MFSKKIFKICITLCLLISVAGTAFASEDKKDTKEISQGEVLGVEKTVWIEYFKLVPEITKADEFIDLIGTQETKFNDIQNATTFKKIGSERKSVNAGLLKSRNAKTENEVVSKLTLERNQVIQMINLAKYLQDYYQPEQAASLLVYGTYCLDKGISYFVMEDYLKKYVQEGKPIEMIKKGMHDLPTRLK